jgi:hypothetical protein
MPIKVFSREKILNILENFIVELNKIRLNNLSPELFEFVDIIKTIIYTISKVQFISEDKLIDIDNTINEYAIIFLQSVNNNAQFESIIHNNYNKAIKMLYDDNNNNIEDLYKIKYIKYKKKYIKLKKLIKNI